MEMKWLSDTMKMTVRWKVRELSQIEPENCPSKCEKQTKEEMIGGRGEFWAESEKEIEQEEIAISYFRPVMNMCVIKYS